MSGNSPDRPQPNNRKKILELIREGEGQLVEWKDSRIISDSFKLARSLSSLANTEGGFILVGVRNDGSLEGLKFKTEHETQIMNIASEKCNPPIRLQFANVAASKEADVYVLKVQRRESEPFHGVKTRDGLVYFTRVGSTIDELQPYELSARKEEGVKINPYTPAEKGTLFLIERLVIAISSNKNWSLEKTIRSLTIIGITILVVTLSFFMALIYGLIGISIASFPTGGYLLIIIDVIVGLFLTSTFSTARETKCPACRKYFKYKIAESEVLEKRNIDRDTEEWKVHNTLRCENCGYQAEKTKYEKHDRR